MARRAYKFTDKKHARQGIASALLAVLALIFLWTALALAYYRAGNAGSLPGLLGVFSMLFSCAGLVLGVRGFQEEDAYYLFSQIGVVLNSLLFVFLMLIFVVGM